MAHEVPGRHVAIDRWHAEPVGVASEVLAITGSEWPLSGHACALCNLCELLHGSQYDDHNPLAMLGWRFACLQLGLLAPPQFANMVKPYNQT